MAWLGVSAGQECLEYIQAVRLAAARGSRRLLAPVRDDYELHERRRSDGRAQDVLLLTGLCAAVEVRFLLPLEIPDGYDVFLDTSRGHGCWIYGPGVPPEDPGDLMGLAFDDCPGVLSALILPELFGAHRLKTVQGWRDLTQSYRIQHCRYVLARKGLKARLQIELEAR